MSSPKSPSTTTTISKSEPPAYIQPYAINLMNQGAAVANRPYEAYGGQRIAELAPEQQMGLYGTTQRALQGNAAVNAGQNMLQGTLRGDYLDPNSNPWFKNTVDTALGQAQGRLNTQFNRPGAFGSTAHQEVMARGLGDIANQMYSQNYMNERANQMGAAGQALNYGQADYQDLNALLSAGDTRRQYSQDLLNQAYQDWLEQRNYPLSQLDVLGNTIGMSMGNAGTTSTTQPNPYQPNTAATLLGAGTAGLGLYNLLKG